MNRAAWLQDRRMQKFRDVLSRWEAGELSMMEAGELLGMSERQFRRYRDRYEEDGSEGLVDRRLGKPSSKRVPATERERMLALYREVYRGWNVKHFHEHLRARPRLPLGLHLGEDAAAHGGACGARQTPRGASAQARTQAIRRHDAAPGRLARRLACGRAAARPDRHDGRCDEHDLLGVPGRGRRHGIDAFVGLLEVFTAHGLPSSLYTDRGSHYFYTPQADGPVDKQHLTQVGRALKHLGIEHIPAYSPEARGRCERMFGTLQDRLIKELALAGITDIAAANRFIRKIYLPQHNARFAKPAALTDSAFVAADPALLSEVLCIEEERIVARDNTVVYGRRHLQLPATPSRAHYVKATVRIREYPDGCLAVFHGPRRLARYDAAGKVLKASNLRAAA